MDNEKHISLRIEETMLHKFKRICSYEGRSMNGQILVLIRDFIADYENKFSNINVEKLEEHKDEM